MCKRFSERVFVRLHVTLNKQQFWSFLESACCGMAGHQLEWLHLGEKYEASFLDMNNTISADFAIKKSPYAELHFQVPGNSRRFLIHKL